MIQNDKELAITQARIGDFVRLLSELRVSSRPEEFPLVTSGYRSELEKMQREVLDYLSQPASAAKVKAG